MIISIAKLIYYYKRTIDNLDKVDELNINYDFSIKEKINNEVGILLIYKLHQKSGIFEDVFNLFNNENNESALLMPDDIVSPSMSSTPRELVETDNDNTSQTTIASESIPTPTKSILIAKKTPIPAPTVNEPKNYEITIIGKSIEEHIIDEHYQRILTCEITGPRTVSNDNLIVYVEVNWKTENGRQTKLFKQDSNIKLNEGNKYKKIVYANLGKTKINIDGKLSDLDEKYKVYLKKGNIDLTNGGIPVEY